MNRNADKSATGDTVIPQNCGINCGIGSTEQGMFLRDYFAGQVISSLVQSYWVHVRAEDVQCGISWHEVAAKDAYRIADAMIRVREERSPR